MVNQTIGDDHLTELYDFFENAPIAVQILRADGTIRYANQADLRLTGYAQAPDEYVDRDFADFHADRATADQMRGHWGRGRPVLDLRTELTRRDGSSCSVVIHASGRMRDGELTDACCFTLSDPPAVAQDTSRPSAVDVAAATPDEERGELLDLLSAAFENAPIGLHIVGPDGIVRRANRMELETLGYADRPEDYIGHHIAEFHAEQAVIDDMLERLVGGRPLTHYSATLLTRGGETKPVIIYSSPRFAGGEFLNTRCFTFSNTIQAGTERPTFGWPRNDDDAPEGPATGELTTVLQRLAGRKHAEESLGFLAETSAALERADDHIAGMQSICRLAVPFLADACSIEVAVGTAAPQVAAAVGPRFARSEGTAPTARAPFATLDGAHGALLLTRSVRRTAFGPADLALAEELARRVAMAVENGQLRERLASGSHVPAAQDSGRR